MHRRFNAGNAIGSFLGLSNGGRGNSSQIRLGDAALGIGRRELHPDRRSWRVAIRRGRKAGHVATRCQRQPTSTKTEDDQESSHRWVSGDLPGILAIESHGPTCERVHSIFGGKREERIPTLRNWF